MLLWAAWASTAACAATPKPIGPYPVQCRATRPTLDDPQEALLELRSYVRERTFSVDFAGVIGTSADGEHLLWASALGTAPSRSCRDSPDVEVRLIGAHREALSKAVVAPRAEYFEGMRVAAGEPSLEQAGRTEFCKRLQMREAVRAVEIVHSGRVIQRFDRPAEDPVVEVWLPASRRAMLAISYDELSSQYALTTMHIQDRCGNEAHECSLLPLAQRSASGIWPFRCDQCWNRWQGYRVHEHWVEAPYDVASETFWKDGPPALLVIDDLFVRTVYTLPFAAACGLTPDEPVTRCPALR